MTSADSPSGPKFKQHLLQLLPDFDVWIDEALSGMRYSGPPEMFSTKIAESKKNLIYVIATFFDNDIPVTSLNEAIIQSRLGTAKDQAEREAIQRDGELYGNMLTSIITKCLDWIERSTETRIQEVIRIIMKKRDEVAEALLSGIPEEKELSVLSEMRNFVDAKRRQLTMTPEERKLAMAEARFGTGPERPSKDEAKRQTIREGLAEFAWSEDVLAEYGDSIAFLEEHYRGPEKKLEELSHEELLHFLRFVEAGLKDKHVQPDSRMGGDETTAVINLVAHKILFRGEDAPWAVSASGSAATVQTFGKELNADLSLSELPALLKIAHDGPPEYAALASEWIFKLRVQHEEDDGAGSAWKKTLLDMANGDSPHLSRLAYKQIDFMYSATPEQKINMSAVDLWNGLSRSKATLAEAFEKSYNQLCVRLAELFMHSYFNRDHETITDNNLQELGLSVITTSSIMGVTGAEGADQTKLVAGYEQMEVDVLSIINPALIDQGQRAIKRVDVNRVMTSIPDGSPLHILSMMTPTLLRRLCDAGGKRQKNMADTQEYKKTMLELLAFSPPENGSQLVREATMQYYIPSLTKIGTYRFPDNDPADEKRIESILKHSTGMNELLFYAGHIFSMDLRRPYSKVKEAAIVSLEARPDLLPQFILSMASSIYTDDHSDVSAIFVMHQIFSARRIAAGSPLMERFLEGLKQSDVRLFYPTCVVAGDLISQPGGETLRGKLIEALFATKEDFSNPNRIAVVRNICERLEGKTLTEFMEDFALRSMHFNTAAIFKAEGEGDAQYMLSSFVLQSLLGEFSALYDECEVRMKNKFIHQKAKETAQERKARELAEAEQKKNAPMDFLRLVSGETFQARNIAGSIADILENRNIHLGDPRRVSVSNMDSPLAAHLRDVELKHDLKNAEEADEGTDEPSAPRKTLACIANFKSAEKGAFSLNCRLEKSGALVLRILENGIDVAAYRWTDMAALGISEAAFDELHHLALEALKVIYLVKKTEHIPLLVVEPPKPAEETSPEPAGEPAPAPVSPDEEPETADEPKDEQAPLATPRLQGRMKLDLTDREKEKRKPAEDAESDRIRGNRRKAHEVFSPLNQGEVLPAEIPEAVKELELHYIDLDYGPDFFSRHPDPVKVYERLRNGEISPDDVHVRKSRAHAMPLPYYQKKYYTLKAEHDPQAEPFPPFGEFWSKGKDKLRPTPEEMDVLHDPDAPESSRKHRIFAGAKAKEMGEAAEMRHGFYEGEPGAESISLKSLTGFLWFDVPDSPHNRALFDRMRAAPAEARFARLEADMKAALQTTRRALAREHLEKPDPDFAAYAAAMQAEEKGIREDVNRLVADIMDELREVADKTTMKQDEQGTVLMLPQNGFTFGQTFNQGDFESLTKLLKRPAPKDKAKKGMKKEKG